MRVEVEDGRLRAIESHPDNLATPEGVCLKGLSYIERVYAKDRILHPLRRTARRQLRADLVGCCPRARITTELISARDRYGPRSVFFYTGSGTKGLLNEVSMDFWRLFGGCTTTYGDLCWPAGLEATRLTLGDNKHNAPWDLVNARLIIFWGKNPAETNIHQMRFRRGGHRPRRPRGRDRPPPHPVRRRRRAAGPDAAGYRRCARPRHRPSSDRSPVDRRRIHPRPCPRFRGVRGDGPRLSPGPRGGNHRCAGRGHRTAGRR